MLLHLLIFFSNMNLSIFSFSDGKLTIRIIHEHIVITLPSIGNHE